MKRLLSISAQALCLLLLLASLSLWVRSYWVIDRIDHADGRELYWLHLPFGAAAPTLATTRPATGGYTRLHHERVCLTWRGRFYVVTQREWLRPVSAGRTYLTYRAERVASGHWIAGLYLGIIRPRAEHNYLLFSTATWHGTPMLSSFAGPGYEIASAVSIPLWLPAIFFALPLIFPLRAHLRRRRLRYRRTHNLCSTCGYDLRAHTPNSGLSTPDAELPARCPECGTPIAITPTRS